MVDDLFDLIIFLPLIVVMFYVLKDAFGDKKKDNSETIESIEKKLDKIIELLEKDKET